MGNKTNGKQEMLHTAPHIHDHGHTAENAELIQHFPEDTVIESVSDALKQLGDPSRLRIFWLLCHTEDCVTNIAAAVSMTSPAVSHHLKLLKSAGLIISRREGKEMYYKASDTELSHALHHIVENVGKITCPTE